jgi:hypothetical protein
VFAPATRRPARRTAFTFMVAAATLALFACGGGGDGAGDDISGPPDPQSDNIFGTWILESVSGEQLPARVNQFRDDQLDVLVKAELVSGQLTLKQDQTFEYAFVSRATVGSFVGPDILIPPEGALQGGAWVRDGNVLHRIREAGQPADSLVLTGSKLRWVVAFPQGAPGSTIDVAQTLLFGRNLPAK